MKRDLVIFIDSGDTLVDESTEIKDSEGTVLEAGLFPGAWDTLKALHEDGYAIALVADGTRTSFDNIYLANGLDGCFSAKAISGDLGATKPAEIMFTHAMNELGLGEADKGRIVMIGNNLKRDIVGANRVGIVSILAGYSPRYNMQPENEEETPDFIVASPSELIGLLGQLDQQVRNRCVLKGEPIACFEAQSEKSAADRMLAVKYAPHLYFDRNEPFPVDGIGFHVFRESSRSRSFNRDIRLVEGTAFVIEYAIYYDYDIQHMYDLEHVWIHVGHDGQIRDAEASAHGGVLNLFRLSKPLEAKTHVPVFVQPGKHAMLPDGEWFKLYGDYEAVCGELAGVDGLLVPEMLRDVLPKSSAIDARVCARIRENYRFRPTLDFRHVPSSEDLFMTWDELIRLIPDRIRNLLTRTG